MLNNISWAGYTYAIIILVIIYYAFVLIVYYRNDLQNSLVRYKSSTKTDSVNRELSPGQNGVEISNALTADTDQNTDIPELLLSIQSLIKNGAARDFPKEELFLALQLKLQHHITLKDSIFKDSINNFIIAACENYCSMHLNGDEVSALWIK